jgi:hypothetical protein
VFCVFSFLLRFHPHQTQEVKVGGLGDKRSKMKNIISEGRGGRTFRSRQVFPSMTRVATASRTDSNDNRMIHEEKQNETSLQVFLLVWLGLHANSINTLVEVTVGRLKIIVLLTAMSIENSPSRSRESKQLTIFVRGGKKPIDLGSTTRLSDSLRYAILIMRFAPRLPRNR